MSVANWISLPNLGDFVENYNFNLNPLILYFEATYGSSIKLINGALPDGLRWKTENNTVIIEGESTGVSVSTDSNFTLRIQTPTGMVGDRTFYINIIPISALPSWDNQSQFLGYATVGTTATFTVTAVSPTTKPVTYRIIKPPVGMTINQETGVITYAVPLPSPLPMPYEINNVFKIRASIGTLYEDLTVTVTVLGIPHVPAWITNEGEIGKFLVGQYLEYTFEAYESQGNPITYTLLNPPIGFPFVLTTTGFMHGLVPFTRNEPLYTFTIVATSSAGSSQRTFGIQAIQETSPILINWNTLSGELGKFKDGKIINIDIGATSKRSNTVNHSFIGGTLPPNLTLNLSQGFLAGFIEYHPQPRDYFFEIMANDGTQTIIRKYSITIEPSVHSQFADVTIPITGELKQSLLDTTGFIIGNANIVPYSNTQRYLIPSEMILLGGMNYAKEDPDILMTSANLYLHTTSLMIGNISNVAIDNNEHMLFYRNIVDPQAGANSKIITNTVNPNTVYPISLNNMRKDIINNIGFANDGQGSGLILWPNVDAETTSVESINIINSGNGYYFSPTLSVSGTGNGAVVTCTLTVQSVKILNGGQGWTQNQNIDFMINKTQSVKLLISAVDINGSITGITVVDGGNFNIFPQGQKTLIGDNNVEALVEFNLGINQTTVQAGGVGYGYTNTKITYSKEMLPEWQKQWEPFIPIGTVFSNSAYQVISREPAADSYMRNLNPWRIQHFVVSAQGKTWTGNTMFDEDICTFDGNQTGFVEWSEPTDTIFELDNTIFDLDNTVFDINKLFVPVAYRMWGTTIFDKQVTFFDVYRTIFDEAGPSTQSITLIKKLYRLRTKQISGNNVVV